MSTNQTNLTTVPINLWAVQTTIFIYIYVNRSVGLIGILGNLMFLIILTNKKLKHKIYDFLLVRQITHIIFCVVITMFIDNCFDCQRESTWFTYYAWFISCTVRTSLLAAFISDIILSLNRYSDINRQRNFLINLSKRKNLLICLFLPLILSIPTYFPIHVDQYQPTGKYRLKFNQVGLSLYFQAYTFVLFLFETIIPLLTFLLLNILSVIKFKRQMAIHSGFSQHQNRSRTSENRFTRMVLILSIVTSFVRFIDLTGSFISRFSYMSPNISQSQLEILTFLKCLSVLIVNLDLSFDFLIYIKMDVNLWNLIFTC